MNNETQPKLVALILECPDLNKANEVVLSVFEDLLADFVLYYESDDERIDDKWYRNQIYDRVYNEHGEIVLPWSFTEEEQRSFIQDPMGHITQFAWQVEDYIRTATSLNEEQIDCMHRTMAVDCITISQKLNNHVTLLVRGNYHGIPHRVR